MTKTSYIYKTSLIKYRYSYMRLTSILFLSFLCSIGYSQNFTTYEKFDDFEHLLHQENDTTYVVNFWATWCGPCVKELPYFEELHRKVEGKKIKVILVSLDFKRQIEKKFIPFLQKNNIKSDVVLLLDPKEVEWIDKVDTRWSGAIPITIVYKGEERAFLEEDFANYTELENFVNTIYKH